MILWFLAAISLGFATAFVARAKGRSFLPWLAYGAVLGVVALPHVLLLREREERDLGEADSPTFDLYTAMPERREPGWMAGEEKPARAALYTHDPHVRTEVSAVWSEDAFARIAGHPQGAGMSEGSGEPPLPPVAQKGDVSFVARRPEPERAERADAMEEPAVSSPSPANGVATGPRDFLISDSAKSGPAIADAGGGREPDDARPEPAFELGHDDAWQPRESEEAFIARRFAPDPFGARARRGDRRRDRPDRGTGWRYALAAVCVAFAVALLWPRFADLVTAYENKDMTKSAPVTAANSPRPPAPVPSDTLKSTVPDRPSDQHQQKADTGDHHENAPPNPVPSGREADEKPAPDAAVPQPPPLEAPLGSSSVAKREVTPPSSFPSPGAQAPEPPKAKPVPPRPARKAARKKAGTGEFVTAVGQVVVLVQAELKKRGYDPGQVNGRAGEKTREAIRAFKRKKGLTVDGSIDNALLENLGIVGRRLHPFKAAAQ